MAYALLALLDPLSVHEREVLHRVAQGASNQEIVEVLRSRSRRAPDSAERIIRKQQEVKCHLMRTDFPRAYFYTCE